MMSHKITILIFCLFVFGCQGTKQRDPIVQETQSVNVTLSEDEAIIVLKSGSLINEKNRSCIVESMIKINPDLTIIQDNDLSNALSKWLDSPKIENFPIFLDKTEIKEKIESHNLRYFITIKRFWWGMEAEFWNLKNRKFAGAISSNSLQKIEGSECSGEIADHIIGLGVLFLTIYGGGGDYIACKDVSIMKSDPQNDCLQLGDFIGKSITSHRFTYESFLWSV